MDNLTLFGLFAVTAMMICYALEKRSHWFVLCFAGTCVLASTYGFLQGAWPFGVEGSGRWLHCGAGGTRAAEILLFGRRNSAKRSRAWNTARNS
jgi:hypothetical protein